MKPKLTFKLPLHTEDNLPIAPKLDVPGKIQVKLMDEGIFKEETMNKKPTFSESVLKIKNISPKISPKYALLNKLLE